MNILYKITPTMKSMQDSTPWRIRVFCGDEIIAIMYASHLTWARDYVNQTKWWLETNVRVELWEHDTLYAEGQRIMQIEDDADWAIAILAYTGQATTLFATEPA